MTTSTDPAPRPTPGTDDEAAPGRRPRPRGPRPPGPRPSLTRPRPLRWAPRRRFWVAGALVLALAVPVIWVQCVGQTRVRPSPDAVDHAPVALVLGAGLRPDGSPSTYLRRRLDMAIDLYERGLVDVVLVSGDRTDDSYDEPAAMRDWLIAGGLPAERIVRDDAGFDTHDSCVRAREVFGVDEAIVVTQDYHLRRALYSCAAAGVDAVGVGVSATSVEPAKAIVWRLREVAASFKAAVDAWTDRRPAHAATPSDAVEVALATEVPAG